MRNEKLLLISVTKGGHKRHTFCPNKKVANLADEYIKSRGGKVVALRNYSDSKYLEVKIRVRTDELVDAIETYHMVKDMDMMDKTMRDVILNTLINSIEGHISTLMGLIRRVEVKHYNVDGIDYPKEVIDKWLEEEEY